MKGGRYDDTCHLGSHGSSTPLLYFHATKKTGPIANPVPGTAIPRVLTPVKSVLFQEKGDTCDQPAAHWRGRITNDTILSSSQPHWSRGRCSRSTGIRSSVRVKVEEKALVVVPSVLMMHTIL